MAYSPARLNISEIKGIVGDENEELDRLLSSEKVLRTLEYPAISSYTNGLTVTLVVNEKDPELVLKEPAYINIKAPAGYKKRFKPRPLLIIETGDHHLARYNAGKDNRTQEYIQSPFCETLRWTSYEGKVKVPVPEIPPIDALNGQIEFVTEVPLDSLLLRGVYRNINANPVARLFFEDIRDAIVQEKVLTPAEYWELIMALEEKKHREELSFMVTSSPH